MVVLYVLAGANHFIHPQGYINIMPHFIPADYYNVLVIISGICEILFALLLIPASTRRVGAWLIITLLLAVFPANIQMFVDYLHKGNPLLWATIVRLPLQVVLIWWAYGFTKQE
jgi:uncharacterized membrane protein